MELSTIGDLLEKPMTSLMNPAQKRHLNERWFGEARSFARACKYPKLNCAVSEELRFDDATNKHNTNTNTSTKSNKID